MAADDETFTVAQTYTALHTLLMSVASVDDFLNELAGLAAGITFPAPVSCGITVEYDTHPLTVSSSDGFARSLDETQYQENEGPCLQSMRLGQVVEIKNADQESRWPPFVERARAQGLRSSLSLPLIVSGTAVGAVNFYSAQTTEAFQDEVRQRADLFAAQASTAWLLAGRQVQQSVTNQQLETALTSRSVIDQAIGIIMGQQGCSADDAFGLLRSHSQNTNRPLRDIAARMVSQTGGLE